MHPLPVLPLSVQEVLVWGLHTPQVELSSQGDPGSRFGSHSDLAQAAATWGKSGVSPPNPKTDNPTMYYARASVRLIELVVTQMIGVDSLVVHSEFLAVHFAGRTRPEHFSWLWLLDHSQDESRWNAATSQRKADAPPCVDAAVTVGVHAEVVAGAKVCVHWADGSPHGMWPITMLAEAAGLISERVHPVLWRVPPEPEAQVSHLGGDQGVMGHGQGGSVLGIRVSWAWTMHGPSDPHRDPNIKRRLTGRAGGLTSCC